MGLHPGRSETGHLRLRGGVRADGHDLVEMDPQQLRAERGRHELVDPVGIGEAALDRGDTVEVGGETGLAAGGVDVVGDREVRGAVAKEGDRDDADPALDPLHLGESRDPRRRRR